MGCLKLAYYEQERALEVNPIFFTGAVEKKRYLEKNRLSSSTYGFQGQEKDDEIKGAGNSINFKFRMYDPRIGRFFAPDPLIVGQQKFPWYSPYQFAGNKPIWKVDLEGLQEGEPSSNEGDTKIKVPSSEELSRTFGPDAQDKIFNFTEDPNFAKDFDITFNEKGQERLAGILLNISLQETPQKERETNFGQVVEIATQLSDKNLISEDNPGGFVEGTFMKFTIPVEFIPKNTGSTLNPGQDPNVLPKVDLGEGKSIVFTINVVIDHPN